MWFQRHLLRLFFYTILVAWLSPPLFPRTLSSEEVLVLEDFDDASKLSQRWTALGRIGVQRTDVPATVQLAGVNEKLVRCDARANTKFLLKPNFPRPPYEKYDVIRFRLRAETASAMHPVTMEFHAFSQHRRAALWRKFAVDTNEWQTIELPMQYFRYSTGSSLDWSEVSRFGFHFRDRATVQLDGIELVVQDDASPFLSVHELAALAFGDDAIVFQNDRFAVLTNDKRVQPKTVMTEFNKLFAMIYADFPKLKHPVRPVPTLIFASQPEYQQFWPKFGSQFAATVPPVRSSGYSLLGVAGSYYSDDYGSVRPVLIHEVCHAILGPVTGVSNSSEWLHEGLANFYQLAWTKQDVHQLVLAKLKRAKQKPLADLLNGKRVALADYDQVTSFVSWLMRDAERKRQLANAIDQMRKRSSTALEPISQQCFGHTLDHLELVWLRWLQRQ